MDILLAGRVLAVLWIAICLWIGWVNMFFLFFLLIGVRQSGERKLSIWNEGAIVLFCAGSATAAGTWAFDSAGNIPRNVGEVVVPLAVWALSLLIFRILVVPRGF